MYLYLLTQTVNNDYDTYDSMVVAAFDSLSARFILPWESDTWGECSKRDWAEHPDQVEVKLIGKAVDGTKTGVIISSFNAG